jgi:tetratricopeptide (TPR) repeat protein
MKRLVYLFALSLILVFACTPEKRVITADSAEWEAHLHLDSALEYIDHQHYEHAMIQLKTAEKLLPIINNDSLGYRICLYIGWLNEQAGAHQLALDYEQMAKIYADATENQHYIVNSMIHQVNTLNNMGRIDEGRQINEVAMAQLDSLELNQQSTLLCNQAYYLMLEDSLVKAERLAYRAAMIAEDSASMGNALSVLSRITLHRGDEQRSQILMSMIPPSENLTLRYNRLLTESELEENRGNYKEALETQKLLRQISDSIAQQRAALDITRVQTQFDQQWHQRRSAERSFKLSLAIIFLILSFGAVIYVYFRRQQVHHREFQERISEVRSDMNHLLLMRSTRLEDLKIALDSRMEEIEMLKKKLTGAFAEDQMYVQISELKQGIDALNAIFNHENISQYGRQEQQASLRALWLISPQLATMLDNPDVPLTPKETFFCIMEHYDISDDNKIDLFCCTEQALRSTKSRLSKKIDLKQLHQ